MFIACKQQKHFIFIFRLVASNVLAQDSLWIGVNDFAEKYKFRWIDGTIAKSEDLMWNSGQPNDLSNLPHCVRLYRGTFGSDDANCDVVLKALCERSVCRDPP